MVYPTGLLLNIVTGRYHPIYFRRMPMPGCADDNLKAQRFQSGGHHTAGFATKEEAIDWIASQHHFFFVEGHDALWQWDGRSMPALIWWASEEQVFKLSARV